MKPVQKQKGDFVAQGEEYIKSVYAAAPPQDRGTIERAVQAGGKVMFSAQTHKYFLEIMDSEGDMAAKLGVGIVQLMMLMHQQTKGKIPLNVWTPAASILLVTAMEFVEKTEGGMDMELFGKALKIMIAGLVKKVKEITGQSDQQQPQQPAQPPTGGLMGAQPQGV